MNATTVDMITALESSLEATYAAAKALFSLAKEQAAESDRRLADDEEWTRLPGVGKKCPVSNWSRTKINKECQPNPNTGETAVRGKTVRGCRYYSMADVRRLLNSPS